MLLTKGLEEEILNIALEELGNSCLNEDHLVDFLSSITHEVLPDTLKRLRKTLANDRPAMLAEQRVEIKGFEERNFDRWKKVFDLFEELIKICIEVSDALDKENREKAKKEEDFKFEALSHIVPKSILVSQEIYCLLRGGFPDGALGRWRTLHEYSVVATFIAKNDQDTALKYLASWYFNAKRSAENYIEYQERANLIDFDENALHDLKKSCESVEKQIGRKIGRDYDWAKEALEIPSNRIVGFFDIEKSVGLDHWRPRYKWATQNTHSSHRPVSKNLASSESVRDAHVVGPSNSGFVDPLQMTAISLASAISQFLLIDPNFERILFSQLVLLISDEIGELAIQEEKRTYEEYLLKE